MIPWLLVVLYLLAVMVVGYAGLRVLLRRAEGLAAEIWVPASFGLGLGFQAIVFYISLALFGKVSVLLLVILSALLIAGSAAWLIRFPADQRGDLRGFELLTPPTDPNARSLYFACAGFILLFLGIIYTNAAQYPFTSYDGRAIWSYKAQVLLHDRTVFNEEFQDPLRHHYHREYPILMPFAMFMIYDTIGHVAERQVRFLLSSVFVFSVLFIFGFLRRFGAGPLMAILLAMLYCATPFRDDWSERDGGALNSGAVDIPLSLFAMIAIGSFMMFWKERQRWQWVLGAVFVAICLMTKKEGIVILAVISFGNGLQALFGLGISNRKRAFLEAVGASLLAVAIALPSIYIGSKMPNFYDEKYGEMLTWEVLSQVHTRIPIVVVTAAQEIIFVTKWSWYWIAFIAMLLLAIPGWFTRREFYLDAILLAWVASYFFVYLVSPLNLVFHLNTSISRLASHFLPLVLIRLGLFLAVREPFVSMMEKKRDHLPEAAAA